MACTSCPIPLNVEVDLTGTTVDCKNCCGSLLSEFPRRGFHVGFNSAGLHLFLYKEPCICPHCGQKATGVECFCGDDGGYYEVTQDKQSEETFQLVPEQQELPLLPFQSSLSS